MWMHICVCAFLFTDLCQFMRQVIVCIYGWCVWDTTLDIYRKKVEMENKTATTTKNSL